MKILIIGDLHGRMPAIHFKDFDMIICTGDVCSDKEFRPLKDAWVRFMDANPDINIGLDTFIELAVGRKKAQQIDKDSLKVGRKILEKLNSYEVPVFIVPGNWDQSYGSTRITNMDKSDYNNFKAFLDFYNGKHFNPKLIRGLKNIRDCQLQSHTFRNVNIIGYGLSSGPEDPTPRNKNYDFRRGEMTKLHRAYQKILQRLQKLHRGANKNPTIFLTHNVPYGTPVDIVKLAGTSLHGRHLGSTVARSFCEKHKPLLCIGGHIHEQFKKCKLGGTTVINAGFGRDANILVDIDEVKGKIRKITFYKK